MSKKTAAGRKRVEAGSASIHPPVRPLARDMRSPLAKARDEWLDSADGKKCRDFATLYFSTDAERYLRNRLESAFIAGANWSALRGKAAVLAIYPFAFLHSWADCCVIYRPQKYGGSVVIGRGDTPAKAWAAAGAALPNVKGEPPPQPTETSTTSTKC